MDRLLMCTCLPLWNTNQKLELVLRRISTVFDIIFKMRWPSKVLISNDSSCDSYFLLFSTLVNSSERMKRLTKFFYCCAQNAKFTSKLISEEI